MRDGRTRETLSEQTPPTTDSRCPNTSYLGAGRRGDTIVEAGKGGG